MKLNYLCLGTKLGKSDNGFTGSGNWDIYKMFYEGDEGYGEFFINFDRANSKAEIKWKDTGYADVLSNAFKKEMEAN